MKAQQILLEKYGEPNEQYQEKYCVVWEIQNDFNWFPATHFLINKDFKDKLFAAFIALQEAGLHTEIKTFDGCYNDRSVRGKTSTSLHAWACAIDLNAITNQMVENPTPQQRNGSWSAQFIKIMMINEIFFGGNFQWRADPMHFGLYNG